MIQIKYLSVLNIQRGQGGKQACFLATSQALHQQHSDLPTLFYLGVRGSKRPMRGIMEHARGGVNKLETGVHILKLFKGADLILLTET
jgi:hypothetical protein